LYGIKNNSNTLLYGIKNNSNALSYGIKNNSNSIFRHDEEIRTNSYLIYHKIYHNSNAVLNLKSDLQDTTNNVNESVFGFSGNSDDNVFTQIAAGPGTSAYGIVDNNLYKYDGASWALLNNNVVFVSVSKNDANKIAYVDIDGNAYYTLDKFETSIRINNETINEACSKIAIGNQDDNLYICVIANDKVYYRTDDSTVSKISDDDDTFTDISVDRNNDLWGIKDNTLYKYRLGTTWRSKTTDPTISDISVLSSSTMWAVDIDNQLWSYSSRKWAKSFVGVGGVLDVSIGNLNNVWIVDINGEAYLNSDDSSVGDLLVVQRANYGYSQASETFDDDVVLGGDESGKGVIYGLGNITVDDASINTVVNSVSTLGKCSNIIDLNGSALTFNGDYHTSTRTAIASSARFSLMDHAFILNNDLSLPDDVMLTFTTSGILDGQGHRFTLGNNSRLKLDPHVTLTLRNIILENVGNTNDDAQSSLCMENKDCRLTLQNSILYLARDYSFTLGRLYIHDDVLISGTNQFSYTSTQACYVDKNSSFGFDIGTTFSYGPSALFSDAKDLIVMTDETSQFYLNGATLKSTTTGLCLTKGTLVIDHKCSLYNEDDDNGEAISVSQAITFGNGTASDDLSIEIMPGGNIELESGILVYQNAAG